MPGRLSCVSGTDPEVTAVTVPVTLADRRATAQATAECTIPRILPGRPLLPPLLSYTHCVGDDAFALTLPFPPHHLGVHACCSAMANPLMASTCSRGRGRQLQAHARQHTKESDAQAA